MKKNFILIFDYVVVDVCVVEDEKLYRPVLITLTNNETGEIVKTYCSYLPIDANPKKHNFRKLRRNIFVKKN